MQTDHDLFGVNYFHSRPILPDSPYFALSSLLSSLSSFYLCNTVHHVLLANKH